MITEEYEQVGGWLQWCGGWVVAMVWGVDGCNGVVGGWLRRCGGWVVARV